MIHTIDDGIGSRDRTHINLLIIPNKGLLGFEGKSIPGVVRVINTEYTRSGKWSKHTYQVDVAEPNVLYVWNENWGSGGYITQGTWQDAISSIRKDMIKDIEGITDDMITSFVRANMPKTSARLDKAEAELSDLSIVDKLFAEQSELALARKELAMVEQEARNLYELEELRQTTEATKTKVANAKDRLSKGPVSLADLKALLA